MKPVLGNCIPGAVGAVFALLAALFVFLLFRRERLWRRTEERFRVLVEKSSDAIALLDPDATIRYLSPSTVNVLGYTSEELKGHSSFELVHPDDLALVRERLAELLAHPDRDVTVECRGRHKDGSWRWLACLGNNRLDEPGVKALVINYRDIGKRKRAEEELLASRQRLQALSRQLLAGQEIERRRLARELHDEIGQVLTVVSINLQGLKAVCGVEAAARLDESMATVARAIEQVRDLSLSLRPAMLDDFGLATALKWYVERLPRGGFEVVLNVETSGERLPGDVEVACFRAVQEALTNAARHARARHVWVDLRQRDEEVELVVRDDG
ncbi:MAG: PAS domain S-box protein, partial [Planctomycetes bacterium]|nr:PAS domain S-box protein [Planctomycetota bacterium]